MSIAGLPPRPRSNSVTAPAPVPTDPVSCLEFGYGLGHSTGILVLKYLAGPVLEFGENRQDFLHQLYWSPDGVLAVRHGADTHYLGSDEGFWVRRAVTHEVRADDARTVYRVCLRDGGPALEQVRAGAVSVDATAATLLAEIARPGFSESDALAARRKILAGIGLTGWECGTGTGGDPGFAVTVARALAKDPGDPTGIDEWAARMHISVKTLQRAFVREYGMSFSRWRTLLRLRASRALLRSRPVTEVAHLVGYASASAFVSAFAREYGHTPGRHAARTAS